VSEIHIVAAPRDENDILSEERTRLALWAPDNGWRYLEYGDPFDLLAQVSDIAQSRSIRITEIEVVAHGNPVLCNGVIAGNVEVIAHTLRRVVGPGAPTTVVLSGCNTGLEFNGECIARAFAAAFAGPVYGAAGYLAGTYAERTERAVASFVVDGIVYYSYPNGRDAVGRDAWNTFGGPTSSGSGGTMQIKIATSGFRAVNLTGSVGSELLAEVETVLRTPPANSARMRIAPDLTFAIRLDDGEHVFELLAGGTVLRDPVTRNVWQFERGREILQRLLPFRTLPAA
jgi:hypothetical protein